jgi:hypothetical protein
VRPGARLEERAAIPSTRALLAGGGARFPVLRVVYRLTGIQLAKRLFS